MCSAISAVFIILLNLSLESYAFQTVNQSIISLETVQAQNVQILQHTLQQGWNKFCESPVDEGVMSLLANINPNEALIYTMTINNQSIELPIKALTQLRHFDISPTRQTIVFVNALYVENSHFSIEEHLKLLQRTRRDLNVIVIDFTRDLSQLYFSVKHHVSTQAYFTAEVLTDLIVGGLQPQDITLIGLSVGANTAALAAQLLYEDLLEVKLGRLIALDPAAMCESSDIYVRPNISSQVIVIHGENAVFGVKQRLGDIDLYPNGIGMKQDGTEFQPGCNSSLCSHIYPFLLLMEALVEGVSIPALKCENWQQFEENRCDLRNSFNIGLNFHKSIESGIYFCNTEADPPFIPPNLCNKYTFTH